MPTLPETPIAAEGIAPLMQTITPGLPAQIDPNRISAGRIVVVADDLTGACDSGVAFLTSGRSARVMLNPPACDANIECCNRDQDRPTVVSFTTETRNLTESQARSRVAAVVTRLTDQQQPVIVFKKVDSAARGNFGAETLATLDASGAALALVAPAFPQTERTLHSGILSVRDCSGQDSRISLRDQFSAVDSARIGVLRAEPVPHQLAALRQAIENGIRILLCDAETQEDLDRLAVAALQLPPPILWVGSAGLARALASRLPASVSEPVAPSVRRRGNTLLFTGSTHPVTHLQLSWLEQQIHPGPRAVFRIQCGVTPMQDVRDAFAAQPVAALIVTGGDTAAFVLQALDASSILLAGELAPGIPWGFVEGGSADGCVVVTKSGGFGERDALERAFEFCERRLYEPA